MLRISPERIYNGDYTQARNSTIQKMLRMIGFGDNIGSGFMKIIKAWADLGFNVQPSAIACGVLKNIDGSEGLRL